MKRFCDSYVNEKALLPFSYLLFSSPFSRVFFFKSCGPFLIHTYILIPAANRVVSSNFPVWQLFSKQSRRFINSIPFLMADPSPLFVLTLMTWVFKEESFCTLITNSFLSQNTRSPSLTLLLPFSQPYPLSPTKLPHHVSGEKSKFFPSQGEDGCLRFPCRS